MASKKIIRTVCFSHREPHIFHKTVPGKFQLFCRLDEEFKGQFVVEVTVFELIEGTTATEDYRYPNVGKAMDRVIKIFDAFNPLPAPEVLYIPEWNDEETINSFVKKWSDNLFGLTVQAK